MARHHRGQAKIQPQPEDTLLEVWRPALTKSDFFVCLLPTDARAAQGASRKLGDLPPLRRDKTSRPRVLPAL